MPNKIQKQMESHNKATTLQILGNTNHAPRIDPRWKSHYDTLIDLRNQLGERKGGLTEIAKEEQHDVRATGFRGLVEPERLTAIPWTRFSAEAQRELEATGSVARTRLGERGGWVEPTKADEGGDDEAEAA